MTGQIEEFYRQYYDKLLLTARTLLGNDAEAYDIVSDVFTDLLTNGKTLDSQQAENYLIVSVRNKCLNLLEHRQVVKRSETALPANAEDTEDEDEEPPLNEVLQYIDTQLPPRTRRVMTQRFLGQKKYNEIAHSMGISRFAVCKHLSQGISQLRAHFAWYYLAVALVLISGVALAYILTRQQPQRQPDSHVQQTIEGTEESTPNVVHYQNATLEVILTDIAAYNGVELRFLDDDARQLRLFYDWHPSEPISDIVKTLDMFEHISIELRQQTIYVQ